MRSLMTVLLAGALVTPAGLTAQPPGPRARPDAPRMQDRGFRMGAQGPGPMQGAFAPQLLLQRKERLSLTEDQVKQLEALATASREAQEKAATDARPHADKIRELWQADQPDAKAIETEMRALMEARHAAGMVAMTGIAKAKGLLTPEQRARVEGWAETRGMAGRGFSRGQAWNRGRSPGAEYRGQPQRRRF